MPESNAKENAVEKIVNPPKRIKKVTFISITVIFVLILCIGVFSFKDKIFNLSTNNSLENKVEQAKNPQDTTKSVEPNKDLHVGEISLNKSDTEAKIDSAKTTENESEISVLEGKIGDYPIRMQLSNKNGKIKGTYTYIKNNGGYLLFDGDLKDKILNIAEKDMDDKVTGRFSGEWNGDKIKGEWKSEVKKFSFELNQVFSFTQKELESSFDKDCVPSDQDLKDELYGKDYSTEIENVLFSQKTNSYYFTVTQFQGPCNGNVNRTWLLYKTQVGSKELKYVTGSPAGMSTGGFISMSPDDDFLFVSRGGHGGYCANYNDFEILDLLNNKQIYDSATKVDSDKIKGTFAQSFKSWVANREIEYEEYTNECTNDPNKPIENTTVKRVKF